MNNLQLPIVHLNGSSAGALCEAYATAADAVRTALDTVCAAAPNGRDYYPAGPDAYKRARAEHECRLDRLHTVQAELELLALHAADERDKRAR